MNFLTCVFLLLCSILILPGYLVETQSVSTAHGSTKRVIRRYTVCSGARCEPLKSLSRFTGLRFLGGDSIDFLHYSRWTRWSPCSRHCSTNRYRACRFLLSCGSTVIREEAFCYHRGSHCELIYESSLGEFFGGGGGQPQREDRDGQQYHEEDSSTELLGPRTVVGPRPRPPPSLSSEWLSDYDDWPVMPVLPVAPKVPKKKTRRQPKKYVPFPGSNGKRKVKPRHRYQNNTSPQLDRRQDHDLELYPHVHSRPRPSFFGVDNSNAYEYNGPFPVDDYNDEPNYNNYGHARNPFLSSNAHSTSNEEQFTCGIAKMVPPSRSYGLSRRILGGSEAQKGRWPWQVAILNRMQEVFCGGTLIAPRWILTAAHCVRHRIYVTIGEHHLHRNDDTEKHYRIEAAFIHPDFETDTVDSDIALLLLPEAVPTQLGLACLPLENQPLPSPSTVCTILGWGKQKYNHVFGANSLNEGKVPIVGAGECRYAYGQYEITSNMFCAGYSGGAVDSCAGDSGGPLLCTDDESRWTVHGVTSFGDGCGRKGKYGIYAKVSNYVAWIKKVMQVNMESF